MPNILQGVGAFVFEEKRSRFIACAEPAADEEYARSVIARIRAQHRTASHHVYAYGLDSIHTRHSDDGEPQGTAGMPVLNVFTKRQVIGFVCVVTRYFGGVKLGAGGLTRAYAKAAAGAMEEAGVVPLIKTTDYLVTCAYASYESMQYFFSKNNIEVISTAFSERCEAVVRVTEAQEDVFRRGALYTIDMIS